MSDAGRILPFASREDILAELREIARDRDNTTGTVSRERARERLEGLDRWEHDLRAQLEESDGR